MAMTTCPHCGEQISDKAKKCVHCGAMLVEEEKKYCEECGAELVVGASICEKCGCPVDAFEKEKPEEKSPQQVEVTGIKIKKRSRKIILITVIMIAAVLAIFFAALQVQKKNAAKEAKKQSEAYAANLELAAFSMLTGAGTAEDCGNLIKQVWYNSIYEEYDTATDKYTRPDGYFVSDFNDALGNLFLDTSFSNRLEKIEESQKNVNSLMKELKKPSEDYEDAYDAISKLYDAYISLTNLVSSPSGSLQTFSENFNDADDEVLNCYNSMERYLGE